MDEKIMRLYPIIDPLLLETYKGIAIDLIDTYLKNMNIVVKKEEIELKYENALFLVICNALDCKSTNSKNIKEIRQGNKSVTFRDNTAFAITDDIKLLLPVGRVKVMG